MMRATNSIDDHCRICFRGESYHNLIQPCNCKGTMKSVHRECLEKWLRSKTDPKCEVCKLRYQVERFPRSWVDWWRSTSGTSYRKELVKDILYMIALLPMYCLGIGLCIYLNSYNRQLYSKMGLKMLLLLVVTIFQIICSLIYFTWCAVFIGGTWFIAQRWRIINGELVLVVRDDPQWRESKAETAESELPRVGRRPTHSVPEEGGGTNLDNRSIFSRVYATSADGDAAEVVAGGSTHYLDLQDTPDVTPTAPIVTTSYLQKTALEHGSENTVPSNNPFDENTMDDVDAQEASLTRDQEHDTLISFSQEGQGETVDQVVQDKSAGTELNDVIAAQGPKGSTTSTCPCDLSGKDLNEISYVEIEQDVVKFTKAQRSENENLEENCLENGSGMIDGLVSSNMFQDVSRTMKGSTIPEKVQDFEDHEVKDIGHAKLEEIFEPRLHVSFSNETPEYAGFNSDTNEILHNVDTAAAVVCKSGDIQLEKERLKEPVSDLTRNPEINRESKSITYIFGNLFGDQENDSDPNNTTSDVHDVIIRHYSPEISSIECTTEHISLSSGQADMVDTLCIQSHNVDVGQNDSDSPFDDHTQRTSSTNLKTQDETLLDSLAQSEVGPATEDITSVATLYHSVIDKSSKGNF